MQTGLWNTRSTGCRTETGTNTLLLWKCVTGSSFKSISHIDLEVLEKEGGCTDEDGSLQISYPFMDFINVSLLRSYLFKTFFLLTLNTKCQLVKRIILYNLSKKKDWIVGLCCWKNLHVIIGNQITYLMADFHSVQKISSSSFSTRTGRKHS